jgi:hypothetical protein
MTKRHLITTSGALFAAMLAAHAQAPAAAPAAKAGFAPTYTAGVDISTAYIFRGATLFDKPVAQPYLSADLATGLTVGAWSNVALDDSDTYGGDAGEVSEVDLFAEYDLPLGGSPIGASVVYTEYTYPNTVTGEGTAEDPTVSAESDSEVGLKLSLETNCALDKALSPTLGVYYGLDGAIDKALYAELGLGHTLENVAEGINLILGGTLGYLEPDEGDSGLSAATLSAGLGVGPAVLKVTYVIETDEDVLGIDEEVVGTLGLSKTF